MIATTRNPDSEPDPTPEQIAERAATIRRTWDRQTLHKRAGVDASAWTPPVVETPADVDD